MTLIEKLEEYHHSLYERWHDNHKHPYDEGAMDAVEKAIAIVKQHSDWISVDERLPNDGDIVEVYRDSYKWGDLIWQCLYTESKGFRNYPVDGVGKNEKITHWRMPTPQPPK